MTLQEDMTFTLEPGIYFVGRFGIRLEQVVAVTSNGASVLSGASLETVRLPT
jgi:Xaa-Pro aminopeptidase